MTDLDHDSRKLSDDAEAYFKMQLDYIKLDMIERATRSISDLVFLLVIVFFVFAGIFLVCLASVLILQQLVGNYILSSTGALIIFSLIAWITIRVGRPRLKDAIAKALIKSAYE